ncbi:MAG: nucleoside phosphorylase [Thermodesulfobacteriota bacterium]
MDNGTPIVKPVKGKRPPSLGSVVVMAAPKPDLELLVPALGLEQAKQGSLFTGRLYAGGNDPGGISLAGPFLGAPHAAMLMETLVSWGARQFVFAGWCGSVAEDVNIGDIVIPNGAIVDEGTSPHYGVAAGGISRPAATMAASLRSILTEEAVGFHEGLVWTTDGAFRETPEKVMYFKNRQALAVEMEMSCLFSVARYLGVDVAGVLVVSDELYSLTWNPGFKNEAFREGRARATRTVGKLCRVLADG